MTGQFLELKKGNGNAIQSMTLNGIATGDYLSTK